MTDKRPAHWSQGGSLRTATMLQSSPRASPHQLRPQPCLAPSSALFCFSLYLFPESTSLINHRHLNFHFRLFFEETPGASLVAQLVKNSSAMWETWVRSLGWEDPLEEDLGTHSIFLVWRIPMDRGAWQATVHGVAKSGTQLSDDAHTHL